MTGATNSTSSKAAAGGGPESGDVRGREGRGTVAGHRE